MRGSSESFDMARILRRRSGSRSRPQEGEHREHAAMVVGVGLEASDAGRIAAGRSTPLTDVNLVVETITVPLFGFAIAVLAVVGAATRSLGNRLTALFGVVGGVAYALASGTAAFTDALDPLFPVSSVIALWALGTGGWLLLRARAAAVAPPTPLTAPAPVG